MKGSCCDCLQSVLRQPTGLPFFIVSSQPHVTFCYNRVTSRPSHACVAWLNKIRLGDKWNLN